MAPNGEQSEVTSDSWNNCHPPKILRGFFMPGSRIEDFNYFISRHFDNLGEKENLHVNQFPKGRFLQQYDWRFSVFVH